MARIPVVRLVAPVGSSNPNGAAVSATLPMRGPAQPREQFPQRALNRTQSAARQATQQATSSDDANCSVIRGWSFTANVTALIPHGLTDEKGRPKAWTSYRIENMQIAAARYFAAHVSAAQDASLIAVTADANCVADIRVW